MASQKKSYDDDEFVMLTRFPRSLQHTREESLKSGAKRKQSDNDEVESRKRGRFRYAILMCVSQSRIDNTRKIGNESQHRFIIVVQ